MQSYENHNKFCQCILFIIKNGFHYVFCCYLKTHHEFISLSWKSLLDLYIYVIDIWKRTSRNAFSWLYEPVQISFSVFTQVCENII